MRLYKSVLPITALSLLLLSSSDLLAQQVSSLLVTPRDKAAVTGSDGPITVLAIYSPPASGPQDQLSRVQTSSASWLHVQSLVPGDGVEIRILKKKKVRGSFVSASDSEFVVNTKGGQVRIAQSEIRQIGVKRNSARLKKGVLGAAIGAAAGSLGVMVADGALTDGNGVDAGAALKLGSAGAVIGFVARVLPAGYSTIYSAP